ncbi:GNAT family N-acetyltransferase [Amycolatopsis sp. NPDC004368]
MVEVRVATGAGDRDGARECWRVANVARGKVPGSERVARVGVKLAEPGALLVVAVVRDRVVGMALAEAGRADDGRGPVLPGLCHLSMVFVRPECWGAGVGTALLAEIGRQAVSRGQVRVQVWTGAANERALAFYRRVGFRPTGRRHDIPGVGPVVHLERCPG